MRETQFQAILDRDEPPKQASQHLEKSLELLKEISNYGARLVIRMFSKSKRETKDITILAILLKHAVTMLDSIEILISQGATIASQLPLRTLLETSIYLDWILKEDIDRRASQYYVWHLRKKLNTNLLVFKGTDEYLDFKESVKSTPLEKVFNNINIDEKEIKNQNDAINKILHADRYKDINAEFDRLKRKHDVAWYKPWGVNSIGEMAKKLGRKGEYSIFYSNLSEITHSHSISQHISFQSDNLIFENVRNLQNVDTIIIYALTLALKIYRKILETYSPAELESFSRKYLNEWRKRFNSVPHIKYNKIEFNVF